MQLLSKDGNSGHILSPSSSRRACHILVGSPIDHLRYEAPGSVALYQLERFCTSIESIFHSPCEKPTPFTRLGDKSIFSTGLDDVPRALPTLWSQQPALCPSVLIPSSMPFRLEIQGTGERWIPNGVIGTDPTVTCHS